jgi:hypothetical protein
MVRAGHFLQGGRVGGLVELLSDVLLVLKVVAFASLVTSFLGV